MLWWCWKTFWFHCTTWFRTNTYHKVQSDLKICNSFLNQVELLRTVFKKRIVSDLVSDLGVSIWSLGTEPETNWIRLNIMWNLSRVSHIRLNFQFIKVLLFKDLVGVQSEILWKRYFVFFVFFVFPTYTQKNQIQNTQKLIPNIPIWNTQQTMVCIRGVQKCH